MLPGFELGEVERRPETAAERPERGVPRMAPRVELRPEDYEIGPDGVRRVRNLDSLPFSCVRSGGWGRGGAGWACERAST
jgi:hypothetical protein